MLVCSTTPLLFSLLLFDTFLMSWCLSGFLSCCTPHGIPSLLVCFILGFPHADSASSNKNWCASRRGLNVLAASFLEPFWAVTLFYVPVGFCLIHLDGSAWSATIDICYALYLSCPQCDLTCSVQTVPLQTMLPTTVSASRFFFTSFSCFNTTGVKQSEWRLGGFKECAG